MKFQSKRSEILLALWTILILVSSVISTEVSNDLPSNHKDAITVSPLSSKLKMEPRDENDDLNIDTTETKTRSSSLIFAEKEKPNIPQIFGSTSKVAVVYSERNPIDTEKSSKPITKAAPTTMEDRNRRKPVDVKQSIKVKKLSDERNWRVVKSSSRDSYLDALDHSHTSKDPREGVIRTDGRPKVSKLIRRDYNEGPVYRPSSDHYGIPKEPISHYGLDNNDDNHVAANNFARISYPGPTQEPFLPTPSDSYSLPIQSSSKFNDNHYGTSPQVSYGSSQPQNSYGNPSNSYGPPIPQNSYVPSIPQNSYGPSIHQNSYGPPASNSYTTSGANHQAYGPPSSTYGAPYANQDYSQHLPSLSSIGFSWPLALKLNVFTLAKILLKLVIFKMIVKFIAVICLLLFIPKLEIIKKGDKDDADEDDDEGRRLLGSNSALERLNILTALVTSSIEKYDKETGKMTNSDVECTSFGCRVRKFVTFDQSWNDYAGLFKSYVTEETNNNIEDKKKLTNHVDS